MENEKWYQNWTWLGYLNFFILQWFFIRLAKYKKINKWRLDSVGKVEVKGISAQRDINFVPTEYKWKYKILALVVPLTGWWNDYIEWNVENVIIQIKKGISNAGK